ncbi:MAG: hypothetical protein ABIF19_03920 [Planctomycetota bacterium]
MNTFWLKIAGVLVLGVGAVVMISVLTSGTDSQPPEPKEAAQKQKTVYDTWDEDDKRLMAEPQLKEPPAPNAPAQQPPASQPTAQQTAPAQPAMPQFKELSEEQDIEAQRLWMWVENQRKMGRLPVVSYGQMVKTSREIIQRWPESKYAFFARRALADLPDRYKKMYDITKEETDLGNLK